MVMPRDTTDEQTELLADMRARIEAATSEIARLTADLTARQEWADELESVVDVALGLLDTPLVVLGDDLRIRALSRGAGGRLEGDAVVGKPLSSVVPEEVFAAVEARLASPATDSAERADEPAASPVEVQPLPGGGAVVMFTGG
jgi:hypothetical protein